jgi:predicted GTPase
MGWRASALGKVGELIQVPEGRPTSPETRFININNVDTATGRHVELVRENIGKRNPKATKLPAARIGHVPESIKGRRVRVVEDGPTLTHEILTASTATRKSLPRKVTKK